MIRIRTASRLHFGLLSRPSESANAWENQQGEATLPRRNFGGVGLMIERPELLIEIGFADTWSAEGTLADRALSFAHTYCQAVGVKDAFRVFASSGAAQHAGLGIGTQLGLAIARAIAELTHQPARDSVTLAKYVARGGRSALGVHGFDRGGFLVEGGKTSDSSLSPLLARYDFPSEWRILLIIPRNLQGMHGHAEIEAFANLAKEASDIRATNALCRTVLLGMMPALQERDLAAFGESLYDFNRRAGEMFRAAQNGIYAHPRIDEIVRAIRAAGIKGVGQSSWGPTIFAIAPLGETLRLCEMLSHQCGLAADEIVVTMACNQGAMVGA